MRSDTAVRPFTATCKAHRQTGYTLIESLFVIGIFSLIVLGMLSIYTTVLRQKNVMLAATDVSAIRSALPRVECTSQSGSIWWQDLEGYLPLRLRRAAARNADNSLDSANPWSGAYVLVNQANSRNWVLRIEGIPQNLREFLGRQVVAIIDANTDQTGCAAGNYCIGFEIEVDLEPCTSAT